jgi:thioredoxin-like negative regulator of GroEL
MRRTIDQQRVRALLGMKDAKRADAIRAELVAAVADDEPARLASLLVAHQKGDLAAAKAAGKPLFSHRQHGSDAKLLIADVLVTAGHADKAKMLREDVAKSYARDPRSYVLRMKAAKALKKS